MSAVKWTIERALAAIGGLALMGGIGAFAYIYVSVSTLLIRTNDIKIQMDRLEASIIPKSEVYIMFELRDEKLKNQSEKIINHEDRITRIEGGRR